MGGLALSIGCAESMFRLAPDSRLPAWFVLPPGLTRADVAIELVYYTSPFRGRQATFVMLDSNGRELDEITAEQHGDAPLQVSEDVSSGDPYPLYEIVSADGITEVLEHRRMEPIFYVTDDQAIKTKLGVTP